MANQIPPPFNEPIAQPRRVGIPEGQKDPTEGLVNDTWQRYFVALGQQTNSAAARLGTVSLTGQNASIGATAILPGASSAGIYRLSYYTRVTTAGSLNSSLTITLGYTDHALGLSVPGTALTTNTTATLQTNTLLFYSDANAPITYSTTYSSAAAGTMHYQLFVVLETVLV